MSEVELENPDEQLNYAIKLIINAYEAKSQIYENEIRRLNQEFEQRVNEYEDNLKSLNQEKESLEVKIDKEIKENREMSEKIEMIVNENRKLEKFKNSILNSINENPNNRGLIKENSIDSLTKNISFTPASSRNSRIENTSKNITTSGLSMNKSLNKQTPTKAIEKPNLNEILVNNAIILSNTTRTSPLNRESRIESLIDKLNESINKRIYDDKDTNHVQVFNTLNRFNYNQLELNKKLQNEKSKTFNNRLTPKSYEFNTNSLNSRNNTPKASLNKSKDNKSKPRNKNAIEIDSFYQYDPSCEEENSIVNNTENKSNQYIQSSKFFAECRAILKPEEYAKLIETLKLCNNNKFDKFEAFKRIESLLQNNFNLLKEFKNIFPTC